MKWSEVDYELFKKEKNQILFKLGVRMVNTELKVWNQREKLMRNQIPKFLMYRNIQNDFAFRSIKPSSYLKHMESAWKIILLGLFWLDS